MDLRCETCRYWDKSYEECHLGPPTIHPDNLIGIWPGTVASDWCGEHERIELPIAEKEVSTHTPVSLEDVKEYHRRKAAADAEKLRQLIHGARQGAAPGPHTQHPGNKKPPLGVLPLRLWQESNPNPDLATIAKRHIDVCNAVIRYHQAGIHVPPQWLREMGIIVETTRDPGQTTGGDGQETAGEK